MEIKIALFWILFSLFGFCVILFYSFKEPSIEHFAEWKQFEPTLLSKGFKLEIVYGQSMGYIKKVGNIEIRIEKICLDMQVTIGSGKIWYTFYNENILAFIDNPDKFLQEKLNYFKQYVKHLLERRYSELEENGPNYIYYTNEDNKIKANSLY